MSQQYYYNPFGNSSDVNAAKDAYLAAEQKKREQKREIRIISLMMGCAIIAYLVVQLFSASAINLFNLKEVYNSSQLFKYAYNILSISVCAVALPFGIMSLISRKKYKGPIIPNQPLKASEGFAWVCFGVFVCVVANFVVNYITLISQSVFGYELKGAEVDASPDSVFACVLQFVSLALVPAICEELAMRCCSLQLLKKFGKGFSVFAVSIVFGLLHGNIIQFMFAFAVGLILGYVTVQTDNIMPALFIHFINNGMSVTQNIVKSYYSDKMASTVTLILYALFAAAGLVSLLYLASKKRLKMVKSSDDDVLSNGAKFGAFLFPWMLGPFLILIMLTASTIVKK